jgi:antitoxin CptB
MKYPTKHLSWACRRGMLELSLVLLPFFEKHFKALSHLQQQQFANLLEQPDELLYHWFFESGKVEDESLQSLIDWIKHEYQQSLSA